MENKKNQPSAKTIIMWGIPIIILIILVILLILELTGNEDVGLESSQASEEIIIQPTETRDDDIDVQPEPAPEPEPNQVENVFGRRSSEPVTPKAFTAPSVETPDETAEEPTEEPREFTSEEKEKSFIVEEGDSLWKIAQRKDILNDPRKWKTILIQNREKINYTIFSEETGQWKVIVDAGKRLVFKPQETNKASTSFDRTRKKRYAVQLMSLNVDQLEKAVDIVKMLIQDGYHAYLYRTREKIKPPGSAEPQYFYRIRVGFFETEQEALAVGEEVAYRYEGEHIFPPDYWAVLPSYSELNGELIDFGIQRNKPYIIQLGVRNSREEAIEDLKTITSLVDFSYISQKRNPEDESAFLYRLRVGFFETNAEAQKILDKIQSSTRDRYEDAKIMEIRHVVETAPGQTTGAKSIKNIQ